MYGKVNEKLYVDNGGEVEYYIKKESDGIFAAHAFQQESDGWMHYNASVEVSEEMIEKAIKAYGQEDAEYLAAMDELQAWGGEPEHISDEEKEALADEIMHDMEA